jgi:hypothetical protein
MLPCARSAYESSVRQRALPARSRRAALSEFPQDLEAPGGDLPRITATRTSCPSETRSDESPPGPGDLGFVDLQLIGEVGVRKSLSLSDADQHAVGEGFTDYVYNHAVSRALPVRHALS